MTWACATPIALVDHDGDDARRFEAGTHENARPQGRAFTKSRTAIPAYRDAGPGQAPSTLAGSTLTPGPIEEVTATRWM